MSEGYSKKQLVLVVEDNADDEALTLRGLRGYPGNPDVAVVRDGAEALEYLADREAKLPDLILLDLKLPKVGGVDILRRIRSEERTRCIPVVVLTSSDEERDIQECYQEGANSFVCKPIDYAEFNSVVRSIGSYWLSTSILPVRPCGAGLAG